MAEAVREVAALVAGPVVVSLPVCWGKVLRKRWHQMLQGDRGLPERLAAQFLPQTVFHACLPFHSQLVISRSCYRGM